MFALCACSSDDDFPSNEELDKLPTVENPDITSFGSMHIGDLSYEQVGYDKDNLVVIHSADELEKLDATGSITFSTKEDIERKSGSLSSLYSYVDWSRQSLVLFYRCYPSPEGCGHTSSAKLHLDGDKFIASVNNSRGGFYIQTVYIFGIGVVIDKPNLNLKNFGLKITMTTDRGENAPGDRYKVTERWVKH
jgi:hypothetical protein